MQQYECISSALCQGRKPDLKAIHWVIPFILHSGKDNTVKIERSMVARDWVGESWLQSPTQGDFGGNESVLIWSRPRLHKSRHLSKLRELKTEKVVWIEPIRQILHISILLFLNLYFKIILIFTIYFCYKIKNRYIT